MRRALLLALLLALFACEDPVVVGPATPAPAQAPTQTTAPLAAGGEDAGVEDAGSGQRRYADEDFVEVDVQNRDPFRDFSSQIDGQGPAPVVTRYVKMADIAVEEMRLIAIVTGTARPYAMVVDRQNVGHVIEVRDYIGRAEVIQTGGLESMPIRLNWRVDRIRDGEVVLAREDPTAPNQPPVLRTMLLHPVDAPASMRGIVTGPSGASDPSSGVPQTTPVPTGYRLTITPPETPATLGPGPR